jgi:hypothetical protein
MFKIKEIQNAAESVAKLKELYPKSKDAIISILVLLQRIEPSEAGEIRNLIADNPDTNLKEKIMQKRGYAVELSGKLIETGCKGCGSNEVTFVPDEPQSEEVQKEIESLFAEEVETAETIEKPKRGRKKQG